MSYQNAVLNYRSDPAIEQAKRDGFTDASNGVYRPENYVGKLKEAYRLGKDSWVSFVSDRED